MAQCGNQKATLAVDPCMPLTLFETGSLVGHPMHNKLAGQLASEDSSSASHLAL